MGSAGRRRPRLSGAGRDGRRALPAARALLVLGAVHPVAQLLAGAEQDARFGFTGITSPVLGCALVPLVVLHVEGAQPRISMFSPRQSASFIASKIVSMVDSACFW